MISREWELHQARMPLIAKVVAGTATEADKHAIDNNVRLCAQLMTPRRPTEQTMKKVRRALARQY